MKKIWFFIGAFYLYTLALFTFVSGLGIMGFSPLKKILGEEIFSVLSKKSIDLHIFWISVGLVIFFMIINFLSGLSDFKENDFKVIYKKMSIIKFALVPGFILNFISYSVLIFGWTIVTGVLGIIVAMFCLPFTYLILSFSSFFSLLYLTTLQERKLISEKKFIFHTILQYCYLWDILDSLLILNKYDESSN